MFRGTRPTLCNVLALLFFLSEATAQQANAPTTVINTSSTTTSTTASLPAPSITPLHDALMLYRKGDFDGAIGKYRELVDLKQNLPDAYAGLIRTYLRRKDVDQAANTATVALQAADSSVVRVALGELYFRQGKIHDAEAEWVKVINSGHQDARAYFGIARVRWAIAMYKSGWNMVDRAHTLDPTDPEIQEAWTAKLSRTERIKFLENFLAGDNNEDADSRQAMQHYLQYLKARAKDSRGACRLVSKVTATETNLVRLLSDPTHLRGYGLAVSVNGHGSKLLLDTGASGILINRSLAERANLTHLSDSTIHGIGDKGGKGGYIAVADSLKIGELEFKNCTVEILDQRSVVGEDGLIGADVFSSFLVDLDFPNEKLRLSELPKRPEQAATNLALATDEDDTDDDGESSAKPAAADAQADNKKKPAGPQDRYIAPEMKSYTPVYRFGHMLLVPTAVGEIPGKLFLLDSGALTNHITPAAAREVTKVHGDSDTTVKGLSGSVKKVYSADKAILQFGHLRQENQEMLSFDMTRLSNDIGTEISGTLGFTLLRFLDVKIDYRDGLVDFNYDKKRWER